MKVIVCGGRDWTDGEFVFCQLDAIRPAITKVIEGGQRTWDKDKRRTVGGVDFWAWTWAFSRSIERHTEYAAWRRYGKAAGPRRNQAMLAMGPDKVIAFPGGKGTSNMVAAALRVGVPVIEIGRPAS